MSIVSNIISVVIKLVVNSKSRGGLGTELIDISLDEYSDIVIDKIKELINGEKSKIEHTLSNKNMRAMNVSEENIDFVVYEIKELLSKIKITDRVLRKCRYNREDLKDYLCKEYRINRNIIENECDIEKGLDAVAKILIELVRESENFEKDTLMQICNSADDVNVGLQEIFVIVQKILAKIEENDIKASKENDIRRDKRFKNNKKQDYIKNWNSRLFLHQDNDKHPITLKEAFIMPDFAIITSSKRIGFADDDELDDIIEKFKNYDKTSTMLITGMPGIGKTTIVSWIAQEYETDDKVLILRFRDWRVKELNEGLLNAICNKLCCEKEDLEKRVLLLDGFDEIKCLDEGSCILSDFFIDIKDLEDFKCIVTSRPAYIDTIKHFHNIIKLQEFNITKVGIFYTKITGGGYAKRKK